MKIDIKNELELNAIDNDNSYVLHNLDGQYAIDITNKLELFLEKSLKDIKIEDKDKVIEFFLSLKLNQQMYVLEILLERYSLSSEDEVSLAYETILGDNTFNQVRNILFELVDDKLIVDVEFIEEVEKSNSINFYENCL